MVSRVCVCVCVVSLYLEYNSNGYSLPYCKQSSLMLSLRELPHTVAAHIHHTAMAHGPTGDTDEIREHSLRHSIVPSNPCKIIETILTARRGVLADWHLPGARVSQSLGGPVVLPLDSV